MKRVAVAALGLAMLVAPTMAQQNLTDLGIERKPTKPPVLDPRAPQWDDGLLTFYSDRPTFESDFPGLPTEDFELGGVGAGGVQGCPAPIDASTNNACFTPGEILPGISFQDNPLNDGGGGSADGMVIIGAGFNGNASIPLLANTFVDSFEIRFDPGVLVTGMDLVSHFNPDTVDIEIFDSTGALLGSTTAPSTNAGSFFGIASPVAIGLITIDSQTDQAEGVDNVSFSALQYFDNRGAFDARFPGLPVEDFENTLVGAGSVVACDGPFNSATNNACFLPGGILDGISLDNTIAANQMVVLGAGVLGVPSAVVGPNTFVDELDIFFPNDDVYAAGMDILINVAGPVDIEVLGPGGVSLGTTTSPAAIPGVFWGVASPYVITRIHVVSLAGSGELVDNVAFGIDPLIFTDGLEIGTTRGWTLAVP